MKSFTRTIKFLFCWSSHIIAMFRINTRNDSGWLRAMRLDGLYSKSSELQLQEITDIKKGIDHAIGSDSVKVWSDEFDSDKRIFGFEKVFMPDFFYGLAKRYAQFGEAYLGRRIHSYFVLAARMDYVSGNVGSGGGWHRDSAFNHQFKVIVYLSDVDVGHGPFQYIQGSHVPKLSDILDPALGESRFTDSQFGEYFKGDCVLTMTGKAGDAIFVDTKGVHRGKPIEAGCRYAITFYFFDRKVMKHIDEMTNSGISTL